MQGVGRATALLFARNGYNVIIAARNPEKLRATEAELAGAATGGSICSAIPTDITDESSVASLVEDVTAKYESVSILINCAGELHCSSFSSGQSASGIAPSLLQHRCATFLSQRSSVWSCRGVLEWNPGEHVCFRLR
jgi:NAD(P)-dependent dehydrogenase (short-subunit alcohol dehydrogenase family)